MRGAKVGRRALYGEISIVVIRDIVTVQSPVQLWYLNPIRIITGDFMKCTPLCPFKERKENSKTVCNAPHYFPDKYFSEEDRINYPLCEKEKCIFVGSKEIEEMLWSD